MSKSNMSGLVRNKGNKREIHISTLEERDLKRRILALGRSSLTDEVKSSSSTRVCFIPGLAACVDITVS